MISCLLDVVTLLKMMDRKQSINKCSTNAMVYMLDFYGRDLRKCGVLNLSWVSAGEEGEIAEVSKVYKIYSSNLLLPYWCCIGASVIVVHGSQTQ